MHCGVIAPTLEMIESPVEGDIVRVSVDVTRGLVRNVASQDAVLYFADLVFLATVWDAGQDAVFFTATSADATRLPERLSFLLEKSPRKR